MENSRESRATRRTDVVIDALAIGGAACMAAGLWAQFDWPIAAIVIGALAMAVAVVAAIGGGR